MHPLVVIDASIWASRLMPQDVNHIASVAWVDRYRESGGLITAPDFILVEIAASLTRRTGHASLAKESIRYLNYHGPVRIVPLEHFHIQEAARLATDLRLKAGDAIYVALAWQTRCPLVSWDNEQLQRAANLIETYTPVTFPFQPVR
jgi:predicted nucleic acid-binding protein